MRDDESSTVAIMEEQITGRYGLLLSQTQLAELLGRTTGGLRYSLSYPSDHLTPEQRELDCEARITISHRLTIGRATNLRSAEPETYD